MNDTLVLKDGTVIELQTGASLNNLQVIFKTRLEMVECWEKINEENLTEVKIKNGNGLVAGSYINLVLVDLKAEIMEDKNILTTFRLRDKTELEYLTERLEKVEARTETILRER